MSGKRRMKSKRNKMKEWRREGKRKPSPTFSGIQKKKGQEQNALLDSLARALLRQDR